MSFWHFDFLFCTSEKNCINTLLLIVVGQIPTVFTMNSVTFIRVVFAIILIPSPLINFSSIASSASISSSKSPSKMDPERQSVPSVISFFLARSSSSLADLSQSFLRETPSVSSSVESSLLICDAKYAAAPATAVTTPTTFPAFASHSFAFCSRLCLHFGHSVASWSAITFPQSEQIPLTLSKVVSFS